MSQAPHVRQAPEPFVADFSDSGALRQPIGDDGRLHLDRWLPFLMLHRTNDPASSLARRVAVDSPAYLVWSPDDDHAAAAAIEAVAARLAAQSGRLLVITLEDQPVAPGKRDSAELTPFVAHVGAGEDEHVVRAADALEQTLGAIEIDLRHCKVDRGPFAPLLPARFDTLLRSFPAVHRLSLRLPQIHRRAEGGFFPGLSHDLAVSAGDALLRSACAFMGEDAAPRHYRALGRSAYLAVALKADRKLGEVARSFDFLLSISPIDTARARDRFLADQGEKPPRFHYRPLTVDPDSAKRDLYAIDLSALEDPMLERLLSEKRREVDAQLTMLATRNTPAFRPASMLLYGAVSDPLLADARSILASTDRDPPRGAAIGALEIAAAARALIDRYRALDASFDADVEIRDDVSGLLVSGPKLMIGSDSVMPAHRLDALLAHEVSVHLLTYFNGARQGLSVFRTGLAGYEGVQEGLGVFAEWISGGLTRTRLRLLAGRVVAVDAMIHGAGFIDVWRTLTREHGFSKGGAFSIAARVFRSGGLAKDAIYLQGFRAVVDFVAAGSPLDPFWLGKIAPGHVAAIEELLLRGLVRVPIFTPMFLDDEGARRRMAGLRRSGTLHDILAGAASQC